MPSYKIWIHIEKIDEDEDLYEDQGLPDSLAEFNTLESAERFVSRLVDMNKIN